MDNQDKIYWHDAFFAALQLELYDYADKLIFEDEYQLSKEALIMDVLIIKKSAEVDIDKNIGKIFKQHNIFEYKSESDNLSVWDYRKVMGYTMLYSAFGEVPIEDITISFVVTPKPIKLFDYLETIRGFTITEPHPGVYYVVGDTVPIQIIENKKLSAEENVFLKHLRSNLTQKDMVNVLQAYKNYGTLEKVGAYLNRILEANESIFREVMAMSATVRDIIYTHLEQDADRLRDEGRDTAKRDTALELIKRGFGLDEVSDIVKMPLEWVQKLT